MPGNNGHKLCVMGYFDNTDSFLDRGVCIKLKNDCSRSQVQFSMHMLVARSGPP